MLDVTRRGFLKGLAVFGVAAFVSPKIIFNAFKRDYVSELSMKLLPHQRFVDTNLVRNGHRNLMFAGFGVTNDPVEGSIWSNHYDSEKLKYVKKARNELVRFLDMGKAK